MIKAFALAAVLESVSGAAPAAIHQLDQPPYVGEWVVEVIDNIKVMPHSRVTVKIERGFPSGVSSISGSASCNTYRGNLTVSADDTIRVGEVLKTMKACDPARMSEEADFFAVLNAVVGYEIGPNDTLILRSRDGRTITASRALPISTVEVHGTF